MSRQTPGQRKALRSYQQCRDMEAGLLANNGINLWRIAAGVVAGAAVIVLCAALWVGLGRVFA